MSVNSQQPEERTDECEHCDAEFPIRVAVRGNYCSMGCWYRQKGSNVLEKIKSDHRLCATCFKQIKTVSRPPEQWLEDASSILQTALDNGGTLESVGGELVLDATACDEAHKQTAADAVIGYQFETEHTTRATDDLRAEEDYVVQEVQRWSCTCGNVDASHREEVLERVEREQVVLQLLRTLYLLEAEGATPSRPSKDVLFETLREYGRDWPLAIGRAIYA